MVDVAYYNAELLCDVELSGIGATIILWPDGAEFVNITDRLFCNRLMIEEGNKYQKIIKWTHTHIQFSFDLTCVRVIHKSAAPSDGGQCNLSQKDFISKRHVNASNEEDEYLTPSVTLDENLVETFGMMNCKTTAVSNYILLTSSSFTALAIALLQLLQLFLSQTGTISLNHD